MISISSYEELRQLRARQQRLNDASRCDSAGAAVAKLGTLQSQEWASAQLAIAARTRGLAQSDVVHAREVERSFVLTWTLRGTLHLVPSKDALWQLELCGPGLIRATRRRYQQLGLSAAIREGALAEIEAVLSREGALVRAGLARRLAERGIPVAGQAIHHLLRFAALRGLICLGPEIDGGLAYTLLKDWLPAEAQQWRPPDPSRKLAQGYLAAFAPARAADFARWSGLGAAQVKAAWKAVAAECAAVTLPGGAALMPREQLAHLQAIPAMPAEKTVRLLPRYDNYLLGYASRAFMVEDRYAKLVHPGGGLIRTCVIVDGQAVANWKLEKRRHGLRITVAPFASLEAAILPLLEREVEALGEFLNSRAELRLTSG